MNIVEVYEKFPTHNDCLAYLERVRWQGKPKCPYCNSHKSTPMKKEHRYHCNNCNTSYSVTVRTIFHKTKLDLQKWFLGLSLILNAKKGMSSRQLARHLKVNKDTAWYMGMRIRKAMLQDRELLHGIVEMDECYIGGKPRKTRDKKYKPGDRPKRGRGSKKIPVVGMVERGGNVKAKVVKKKKGSLGVKNMARLVRENIDTAKAILITDDYIGYDRIDLFMPHERVCHEYEYARGNIHTNTIEWFWALLKRGIVGQFHKVSIKHLSKYVDEFCYRFNNRNNKAVFEDTLARAVGV
jgi:transposase-like protein